MGKRRQQMKIPLQIHYDKADQILQCFQKLLTDLNLFSSDDGDGDDDNDDDFTTTSVVIKNIWNYMRSVNKNITTGASAVAISEDEDLVLSKMVNNNETIKLYLREMLINNSSSCHIGEDERTETALNFPYTVAIKADMHSSALASLHGKTYTRSLEWLEEHGRCIDGLSIGPSSLIINSNSNNQQRGAFATKEFSVGDSITLAPVLPINRTILHTYQFDMNHPGKHRKLSTKKLGHQLLLNYCYGHPDSSLLFFPYGPSAVNMINHFHHRRHTNNNNNNNNTTSIETASNARIELQFFSTTATNFSLSSSSSLFHQQKQNDEKLLPSLHEILKNEKKTKKNGGNSDPSKQILIVLDFIATKSIQTGDEIFLDYGKEWEDDFNRYIDSWTAPPPRSHNSSKNKNNAVI